MKKIKKLGLMVDCSRNSVLTVEATKRLIDILSKLGYTYLELYTEDTYEVPEEPKFGCMRGRYTKEEIREIDAYCIAHKMTLKPCIQTLGHLESMFRWGEYNRIRDCVNILLAEEDATYEFIDHLFASVADCFSCREINIGMDEAFLLGHGKYYRKHGHVPPREIMKRHLKRVVEIADKYGFKCDMWGDLFHHMAYENLSGEASVEKANEAIPDQVSLIYWDYYRLDQEFYEKRLDEYTRLTNRISFAGGIWTWRGFCPSTSFAIKATEKAMRACQKYGIDDFMQTAWGDDGGECSVFAALPAIVATAEYARGNYDEEKIARRFRRVVGMDMQLFTSLERPNALNAPPVATANTGNYLLYNDPFIGICDGTVEEGQGTFFEDIAKELTNGVKNRKWGYIFKMERALCELLAFKCDLGKKTRRLYNEENKEALLALANDTYPLCVRKLRTFYRTFKDYWFRDKKSFGFEVQDVRIGGMMHRLEECARTIRDYCAGKIDHIAELEEVPPYTTEKDYTGPCALTLSYQQSFTPAKLIHEFYN